MLASLIFVSDQLKRTRLGGNFEQSMIPLRFGLSLKKSHSREGGSVAISTYPLRSLEDTINRSIERGRELRSMELENLLREQRKDVNCVGKSERSREPRRLFLNTLTSSEVRGR